MQIVKMLRSVAVFALLNVASASIAANVPKALVDQIVADCKAKVSPQLHVTAGLFVVYWPPLTHLCIVSCSLSHAVRHSAPAVGPYEAKCVPRIREVSRFSLFLWAPAKQRLANLKLLLYTPSSLTRSLFIPTLFIPSP